MYHLRVLKYSGSPFSCNRGIVQSIYYIGSLQTDEVILAWAIYVSFSIYEDTIRTAGNFL